MDMTISDQDQLIRESCAAALAQCDGQPQNQVREALLSAGMFALDLREAELQSAAMMVARCIGAANAPLDGPAELMAHSLSELAGEQVAVGRRISDGRAVTGMPLDKVDLLAVAKADGSGWDLYPCAGIPQAPYQFDPSVPMGLFDLPAATASIPGDEGLALWHGVLADSEMLGAAESMLSRTVDYVTQRVQYGHPIGSYQAVQHRLVDSFVALQAADVATAYTATLLAAPLNDRTRAWTAASHAYAAEACLKLAKTCFQYHGGMSFTTDFWPQKWLRRITRHSMRDQSVSGHYATAARLLRDTASVRAFLQL